MLLEPPITSCLALEKYRIFTVEEFIGDEYFRSWILVRHPETEHFWLNFQKRYPERKVFLMAARALFISLHESQIFPTDEQGRRMWTIIEETTASGAYTGRPEEIRTATTRPVWRWLSAAAVLVALGLGWFVFLKNNEKPTFPVREITKVAQSVIEKKNTTARPQHIYLSEGSRIILYPGSQVSYAHSFEGETREVYLSGKGYFEVTNDEKKPFIVYANQLVTKVVGTSFIIDAFAQNKLARVEVQTGKVQVFTLEKFRNAQQGYLEEMLLLSANQQTSYDITKKSFATGPIPKPDKDNTPQVFPDFNFQNMAVANVFKTLEESYGVTIEYNQHTLKNCNITAPLDEEPLFRKLDIVCQTIGATYEVFETRIVVSGPGCGDT